MRGRTTLLPRRRRREILRGTHIARPTPSGKVSRSRDIAAAAAAAYSSANEEAQGAGGGGVYIGRRQRGVIIASVTSRADLCDSAGAPRRAASAQPKLAARSLERRS